MSADEYETELTGSREAIAAALSGVVDGVLAGSIRLDEGDETVAVDVPEELSLEVELETEDDEVSLELELEWDAPADGEAITAAEDESVEAVPAEDSETEATEDLAIPVGADDASQSLARFELYRDRASEWRWRLRHRNGNVIATSGEGYTRKHNAWKGLRSVMQNAPEASVEESD